MRKTLIAAAVAGLFSLPSVVMAQAAAPAAAPASPHTITGNLGIYSSYRFRGIDQTFGKPALQGGIDYSHSSGIYLGNWNSNVSSGAGYADGNLEMDFYGGYKATFGDFGLDLGAIYYYYPGSEAKVLSPIRANSGSVNNKEIYIGASWKFLSVKYSYSLDDYFSTRGIDKFFTPTGKSTKGTTYLDIGAAYDLGNGWGINGHVGVLNYDNVANGDYTDWKIGVTKDIGGWVFGLAYVDTNADGDCRGATTTQPYCFASSLSTIGGLPGVPNFGNDTKDAGRGTAVLSVSKSF
jgi:uncharacterized protein (TIGR02001 family)